MKKFLSLALILALAVTALVSCGGDDESTTKADDTTVADTTTGSDDTTVSDDTTDAGTTDDGTTAGDDTTAGNESSSAEDTSVPSADAPDTSKALATWLFDEETDADDWTGGSATDSSIFTVSNGALEVEVLGVDPMIIYDALYLDETVACADVDNITMRIKNCTPDTKGQIFFSSSDVPGITEESSVKFDYVNSGEDADWETIVITADQLASITFGGDLLELRLDPSDQGTEGFVYIDYIVINGK